ncbi:ATP-binding protein [bacterium]|nr:ATP-binding protein [bacterium]
MNNLTKEEEELIKKALQRKEQLQKDKKQEEEFLFNREVEKQKNKSSSLYKTIITEKEIINISPFNEYHLKRDDREEAEQSEEENKKILSIQENKQSYLKKYNFLLNYNFENFYINFDFQKIMTKKAFDFINDIKNDTNKNNWCFVAGQTGAGKTHLSLSIINKLLELRNYSLEIVNYTNDFRKIKSLSNNKEQIKIFEKLHNVDICYLDDLFKNQISPSDIKILHDIINIRYNKDKLTLFSSEIFLHELKEIDYFSNSLLTMIFQKSQNHIISIKRDEQRNYRLKEK